MTEEELNRVLEEFFEREFLKSELGYDNSFLMTCLFFIK